MSADVVLLAAMLAIGFFVGIEFQKIVAKARRKKWQRDKGRPSPAVLKAVPRADAATRVPDAADQLRTVMRAQFKPQPLLNRSEARLFRAIDEIVVEARPGWQVMAQVSLGEILKCDDADAYRCINSKRVDLLIVDDQCRPLHAIEYQGGGHYKGAHATAARDAVKKEALRRAGIGYVEVVGGEIGPAELRQIVDKLVQKAAH
jgi:hypothetical protein